MAAYLNFLPPLTITVVLPLTCPMPGQACIFKAFRASLTLVPARYVAARDPELLGHLTLRAGHFAAEAVAHGDDLPLALGQAVAHKLSHEQAVIAVLNVEVHRVLHTNDIEE